MNPETPNPLSKRGWRRWRAANTAWSPASRADFVWQDQRLIVETDGFGAHGTRAAFEGDRLRDRRLARAGYQTIRVTKRALVYDAEAVAADLAALLSRPRTSAARAR